MIRSRVPVSHRGLDSPVASSPKPRKVVDNYGDLSPKGARHRPRDDALTPHATASPLAGGATRHPLFRDMMDAGDETDAENTGPPQIGRRIGGYDSSTLDSVVSGTLNMLERAAGLTQHGIHSSASRDSMGSEDAPASFRPLEPRNTGVDSNTHSLAYTDGSSINSSYKGPVTAAGPRSAATRLRDRIALGIASPLTPPSHGSTHPHTIDGGSSPASICGGNHVTVASPSHPLAAAAAGRGICSPSGSMQSATQAAVRRGSPAPASNPTSSSYFSASGASAVGAVVRHASPAPSSSRLHHAARGANAPTDEQYSSSAPRGSHAAQQQQPQQRDTHPPATRASPAAMPASDCGTNTRVHAHAAPSVQFVDAAATAPAASRSEVEVESNSSAAGGVYCTVQRQEDGGGGANISSSSSSNPTFMRAFGKKLAAPLVGGVLEGCGYAAPHTELQQYLHDEPQHCLHNEQQQYAAVTGGPGAGAVPLQQTPVKPSQPVQTAHRQDLQVAYCSPANHWAAAPAPAAAAAAHLGPSSPPPAASPAFAPPQSPLGSSVPTASNSKAADIPPQSPWGRAIAAAMSHGIVLTGGISASLSSGIMGGGGGVGVQQLDTAAAMGSAYIHGSAAAAALSAPTFSRADNMKPIAPALQQLAAAHGADTPVAALPTSASVLGTATARGAHMPAAVTATPAAAVIRVNTAIAAPENTNSSNAVPSDDIYDDFTAGGSPATQRREGGAHFNLQSGQQQRSGARQTQRQQQQRDDDELDDSGNADDALPRHLYEWQQQTQTQHVIQRLYRIDGDGAASAASPLTTTMSHDATPGTMRRRNGGDPPLNTVAKAAAASAAAAVASAQRPRTGSSEYYSRDADDGVNDMLSIDEEEGEERGRGGSSSSSSSSNTNSHSYSTPRGVPAFDTRMARPVPQHDDDGDDDDATANSQPVGPSSREYHQLQHRAPALQYNRRGPHSVCKSSSTANGGSQASFSTTAAAAAAATAAGIVDVDSVRTVDSSTACSQQQPPHRSCLVRSPGVPPLPLGQMGRINAIMHAQSPLMSHTAAAAPSAAAAAASGVLPESALPTATSISATGAAGGGGVLSQSAPAAMAAAAMTLGGPRSIASAITAAPAAAAASEEASATAVTAPAIAPPVPRPRPSSAALYRAVFGAPPSSSSARRRAPRPSHAMNEDQYDFAIVVRAVSSPAQLAALARAKAAQDAKAAVAAQQQRAATAVASASSSRSIAVQSTGAVTEYFADTTTARDTHTEGSTATAASSLPSPSGPGPRRRASLRRPTRATAPSDDEDDDDDDDDGAQADAGEAAAHGRAHRPHDDEEEEDDGDDSASLSDSDAMSDSSEERSPTPRATRTSSSSSSSSSAAAGSGGPRHSSCATASGGRGKGSRAGFGGGSSSGADSSGSGSSSDAEEGRHPPHRTRGSSSSSSSRSTSGGIGIGAGLLRLGGQGLGLLLGRGSSSGGVGGTGGGGSSKRRKTQQRSSRRRRHSDDDYDNSDDDEEDEEEEEGEGAVRASTRRKGSGNSNSRRPRTPARTARATTAPSAATAAANASASAVIVASTTSAAAAATTRPSVGRRVTFSALPPSPDEHERRDRRAADADAAPAVAAPPSSAAAAAAPLSLPSVSSSPSVRVDASNDQEGEDVRIEMAPRRRGGGAAASDTALQLPSSTDDSAGAAGERLLASLTLTIPSSSSSRAHKCTEILAALRAAGLHAKRVRSLSRRTWLIKLCAPEWRLEEEAERIRLRLRRVDGGWSRFRRSLRPLFAGALQQQQQLTAGGSSSGGGGGTSSDRRGSLFHSSDRQTLINNILRSPSQDGGAALGENSPLGAYVTHMFPLHMRARLEELRSDWLAIWRPERSDAAADRIGPLDERLYAPVRLRDIGGGSGAATAPPSPSDVLGGSGAPYLAQLLAEADSQQQQRRGPGGAGGSSGGSDAVRAAGAVTTSSSSGGGDGDGDKDCAPRRGCCAAETTAVSLLMLPLKWTRTAVRTLCGPLCKCGRSARRGCGRLLSQPLDRIAAYFGETIAFYFAWLEFYTQWLVLPAAAGVLLFLAQLYYGTLDCAYAPLFSLFMALWSIVFLEFWKRRNAELAQRWGVLAWEDEETPRPGFIGDWKQDERTGEIVRVYPAWKRAAKYAVTLPVMAALVAGVTLLMVLVYSTRDEMMVLFKLHDSVMAARSAAADALAAALAANSSSSSSAVNVTAMQAAMGELPPDVYVSAAFAAAWAAGVGGFLGGDAAGGTAWDSAYFEGINNSSSTAAGAGAGGTQGLSWGAVSATFARLDSYFTSRSDWRWWLALVLPPVLLGLLMPAIYAVFSAVAARANDWENHATESAHRNHLIAKIFVFRFIVSFLSLFYYAFSPQHSLLQLSVQLATFFVVSQTWNNILEVGGPALGGCVRECRFRARVRAAEDSGVTEGRRGKRLLRHATSGAWAEARMPVYDTFTDYAEMLIQFGHVTFFSWAFPLAPLAALLNNVLEMRTDAYKLCYNTQRPIAAKAGGIGVWYNVLVFMSLLAVLTNCAQLALTSHQFAVYFPGLTDAQKMLIVFIIEHAVLAMRLVLPHCVPPASARVMARAARERFADTQVLLLTHAREAAGGGGGSGKREGWGATAAGAAKATTYASPPGAASTASAALTLSRSSWGVAGAAPFSKRFL